jgi:hypothetical protein
VTLPGPARPRQRRARGRPGGARPTGSPRPRALRRARAAAPPRLGLAGTGAAQAWRRSLLTGSEGPRATRGPGCCSLRLRPRPPRRRGRGPGRASAAASAADSDVRLGVCCPAVQVGPARGAGAAQERHAVANCDPPGHFLRLGRRYSRLDSDTTTGS